MTSPVLISVTSYTVMAAFIHNYLPSLPIPYYLRLQQEPQLLMGWRNLV